MEKVFIRCKDLPVLMQPESGYITIRKCWRKLAQSVLTLAITSVFLIMGTGTTWAELIEKDLRSPGDALITHDTGTGLEWLDVTQTANLSFNDVSANFGTGQEFAGFRYATVEEVSTLFGNAGIPVLEGPSSDNFLPVTELLQLIGQIHLFGLFAITADSPEDLYHYMSNIQIKPLPLPGIAWAEPIAGVIPDILSDRWYDYWASPDVGSWLVRSSAEPEPPIAHAGFDRIVQLGTNVNLDGSLSSDPGEYYPLVYEWEIVSQPEGSVALLLDAASVNPSLTPDLPGDYVIELVVINSFGLSSAPNTVYIEALSFEDAVTFTLEDMITTIYDFNDSVLKNPNMKQTLTNKITVVLKMIDKGRYENALDKLANDILGKTDGCAETGARDGNDWIQTCDEQGEIYLYLLDTIEMLENIIAEG